MPNTKKITLLLFSSLLFSLIPSYAEDEKITITTFYPSPYGVYKELATDGLKVGETYSGVGNTPPTSGLIVEGNVGIGTQNPQVALEVSRDANAGVNPIVKIRNSRGSSDDVSYLDFATGSETDGSEIRSRIAGYVESGGQGQIQFYTKGNGTSFSSTPDMTVKEGNVQLKGGIKDNNGNLGTNGQILTSTGNGIAWSGGGVSDYTIIRLTAGKSASCPSGYIISGCGADAEKSCRPDFDVNNDPLGSVLCISQGARGSYCFLYCLKK